MNEVIYFCQHLSLQVYCFLSFCHGFFISRQLDNSRYSHITKAKNKNSLFFIPTRYLVLMMIRITILSNAMDFLHSQLFISFSWLTKHMYGSITHIDGLLLENKSLECMRNNDTKFLREQNII
jgi:hypothetical protein